MYARRLSLQRFERHVAGILSCEEVLELLEVAMVTLPSCNILWLNNRAFPSRSMLLTGLLSKASGHNLVDCLGSYHKSSYLRYHRILPT